MKKNSTAQYRLELLLVRQEEVTQSLEAMASAMRILGTKMHDLAREVEQIARDSKTITQMITHKEEDSQA